MAQTKATSGVTEVVLCSDWSAFSQFLEIPDLETVDEPDDPVLPPQPFIQMPNALHAIPVTWTGVRIEWEEPAREYCELKQYKVKVEGGVDGSSPTEHVIECPPQPCSVGIYTGLVRGGSYQCSVCAVPDQGNESSYSTKLSFTLPTIEPPVLDAQLVETPEEGCDLKFASSGQMSNRRAARSAVTTRNSRWATVNGLMWTSRPAYPLRLPCEYRWS